MFPENFFKKVLLMKEPSSFKVGIFYNCVIYRFYWEVKFYHIKPLHCSCTDFEKYRRELNTNEIINIKHEVQKYRDL